jgi:hypothetical protein
MKKDITQTANKIIDSFITNKGYNYDKQGRVKKYKSGYMVALKDWEKIIQNKDLILNDLVLDIESKLKDLENKKIRGLVIGFWREDDLIYIDLSLRVANKKTAIALGKINKQLAIWDNKNQKAIAL